MSKYTMNQIVTLTGIKAHTLRKWEIRYSFLEPERTDTNIRFYSDEQLKKLLNISVLTRHGYRISKIDKMSDDEIHTSISDKLISGNPDDKISALIICMVEMDEVKFNDILKSLRMQNGLLATITDVVYPFLNQVGVLWGINKVMPAQEHFVSNLIRKKILSAIHLLPNAQEGKKSVLMFLTENEHHEIGLLLAYYIAREMGFKVYYLGQNVPTKNIKQVIEEVNPSVMLTMFVTPSQGLVTEKIDDIISQGNIPLMVSGNPSNLEAIMNYKEVVFLSHPNNLIDFLKQLN